MKKSLILTLVLVFTWSIQAYSSDCGPFGCIFSVGTVCVDGKCVPAAGPVITPTPTPVQTPIPTIPPNPTPEMKKIILKAQEVTKLEDREISCSNIDFSKLQIILQAECPTGPVYYYSSISIPAIQKRFGARKTILGDYAFIEIFPDDPKIYSQSYGEDFIWDLWINPAFNPLLSRYSCDQVVAAGLIFKFGISKLGDRTDYKGAILRFKK